MHYGCEKALSLHVERRLSKSGYFRSGLGFCPSKLVDCILGGDVWLPTLDSIVCPKNARYLASVVFVRSGRLGRWHVFLHFCLRPVTTLQLLSPQCLPLPATVMGRFFAAVKVSIVVILTSSFAIMGARGFGRAPIRWHVMSGNHLAMAAIYFWHYPRLKAGVAVQDWHAAGVAMNRIRVLVATNLLFWGADDCGRNARHLSRSRKCS